MKVVHECANYNTTRFFPKILPPKLKSNFHKFKRKKEQKKATWVQLSNPSCPQSAPSAGSSVPNTAAVTHARLLHFRMSPCIHKTTQFYISGLFSFFLPTDLFLIIYTNSKSIPFIEIGYAAYGRNHNCSSRAENFISIEQIVHCHMAFLNLNTTKNKQ